MRFLIDADLPRSTAPLIRRLGHDAVDVRDINMRSADDGLIAAYAKLHQFCILTGDFGFADIREYPPHEYAGIVVLELPRHATEETINRLVAELIGQPKTLDRLSGHLAIVGVGRVRVRPI